MKSRKRILTASVSLLLCAIMLIGCTGKKQADAVVEVTPMEAEEAFTFDLPLPDDEMPITGFYGPYAGYISRDGNALPDYVSEEYFKMISEAGLNMISYSDLNYSGNPELVQQSLDYCEKYGMGYFVNDTRVTNLKGKENITAAMVAEYLADYVDHPAFYGAYIIDEPVTKHWPPSGSANREMSLFKDLMQIIQYDLGLAAYSSPNPIWDMEKGKNKENYEKYFTEYVETLKPKYLGVYYYPYYPKYDNDELYEYFYNIDLLRQHAEKEKVPFSTAVQAGSQWNDFKNRFDSESYYPDEGHFDWHANTGLAMGSKSITYFPIIQPEHFAWAESKEWDSQRSGLIGALGNKTMWYNFAQKLNHHLAAIDEVLMKCRHKGIIVNGKNVKEDTKLVSCIIESGKFQELQSVEGEALIGCFNYQGKTALYVVNYNTDYAQYITLNLNDTHNLKVIQEAETSYVKAKNLELDMSAGEGVLVVID